MECGVVDGNLVANYSILLQNKLLHNIHLLCNKWREGAYYTQHTRVPEGNSALHVYKVVIKRK